MQKKRVRILGAAQGAALVLVGGSKALLEDSHGKDVGGGAKAQHSGASSATLVLDLPAGHYKLYLNPASTPRRSTPSREAPRPPTDAAPRRPAGGDDAQGPIWSPPAHPW